MADPSLVFGRFRKIHQDKLRGASSVSAACTFLVLLVAVVLGDEGRYILASILALVSLLMFYFVIIPLGSDIGSWSEQMREFGESPTSTN